MFINFEKNDDMKNTLHFILLGLLLPFAMFSQDGSLDMSFGNNGIAQETFAETTRFESVAIQADGKIVVAGSRGLELLVARFLENGSLDLTFGENGFYYNDLGTAATAYKVLVQSDGKIVAFGTHRESGSKFALMAIRLLADGSEPDPDFGADGVYSNLVSGSSFAEDDILDAMLLSDGKIAIAGRSYSGQRDLSLVGRITADGQSDVGFGDNGITLLDFNTFSRINGLVVTAAGDMIVAGTANSSDIFIAAFESDGTLRADFGTDGVTTFNEASGVNNGANDLILLPDGKFLVGGNAFDFGNVDNDIALYRFLADGDLDTDFGNDGIVKVSRGGNEAIQSLLLQPNGKILSGGGTGGFNPDFALSRFSVDGEQDVSFGDDGWSITSVAPGSEADGITAIAQNSDGSIIAAGFTLDDETYSYALAKFNSNLSATHDLASKGLTVSLYPTIIKDSEIQLNISAEKNSSLTLKIISVAGEIVELLDEKLLVSTGNQQVSYSLKHKLPHGAYYLQVTAADGQQMLPFFMN